MARPNDVFVVKYIQAYIKRFNKTAGLPPGVVQGWKSTDSELKIEIFLPTVSVPQSDHVGSKASKIIPWDDVVVDAESMGIK
jgi:hypothetical protein